MSSEAGREDGATARALVICPSIRGQSRSSAAMRGPQARLSEAVGLAHAIGLDVVVSETVPVAKPRPATLIGTGNVATFGAIVGEQKIDLVIVDHPLSPVQQRNLETEWKTKVIDRTGLILEIFGARARTHEGRLQVELAALNFQRSRLVRSWTHLERQRGGFGFLGGPGESQLEIDRRLIDDRIIKLKRELDQVRRTRGLHRRARQRADYLTIALVGYTNAGKSTLFNRLTHSTVVAKDLLFATLDPTMRAFALPSGQMAILSDTVGFISDLPTQLVAAFRATLEEVAEADVIIHVRDIAHPDTDLQREDVLNVLRELGLTDAVNAGLIEALNKIDLLDPEARAMVEASAVREAFSVPVSAATGVGIDALLRLAEQKLGGELAPQPLDVALSDGAGLAWLYSHGEVLDRHDDDSFAHLLVNMRPEDAERFAARQRHR